MKDADTPGAGVGDNFSRGPQWPRLFVAACVLSVLLAFLLHHLTSAPPRFAVGPDRTARDSASATSKNGTKTQPGHQFPRRSSVPTPTATPEQIVAGKLTQFGHSRRELAHALARRHNVEVPDSVEKFFDAVEGGNLDEIFTRFKAIAGTETNASSHASGRPPGIEPLWPAIIEAEGAAESVQAWPAQKLLDYGDTILGSLTPGMVYVGGTDPGRFIPTMLSATSDGEQHIILTQNGLADNTYLDYLNYLYADRMTTLSQDDSQGAFSDYVADARKRLEHDQQFPDEPKQVRPGEDITLTDGKVQISGQVAVMGINELLLQKFMQKNPDLAFGLEESFPLKSTYADATILGPLMQLRAADGTSALTAEVAAQSVDYWRNTAQQLLADPDAPDGSDARKTYSKMAASQANLLADHNYTGEAEQAYRLAMDISPSNPEAAYGLAQLLNNTGHTADARQLIDDFQRKYPDKTVPPAWKASFSSAPGSK